MSGVDHAVDVCIVGGGPAGLVLANLLAERGLATLVLEKAEDFEREFRGEVLQPRFMRAMAQIGLDAFIRAEPHEEFARARFFVRGREVGSFAFDRVDSAFPFATWMPQPVMLRALDRRARTLPSYELWFGARAHALILDGERVVGLRVRHRGEDVDVRTRLVVGADGRFSTLARLGGFETEYEHHPFDVLWFEIERPPEAERQISFYFSDHSAYLSAPKYPDLFQIGMMIRPGGFGGRRERGIDALRDEIRGAHPWFHAFAEQLTDFGQFSVLAGTLSHRRRWARDGLLLIGDAAHTCSPIGAVGVSVAVETAIVAADVILGHPPASPLTAGVLDEVQRRRRGAVCRVHRIQRFAGNAIASRSRILRMIRPVMIRLGAMTGILPRLAALLLTRRDALPIAADLRLAER